MTNDYWQIDPAELKKYSARGDPPMEEWPGVQVEAEDVLAASGDGRDWFRPECRLKAWAGAWQAFYERRKARRNLASGFDWDQIMIVGEYGAGKTTLGILTALKYFIRGHAVFSNASTLFGWRLQGADMYTAMAHMPANSVLLIDEASAHLDSLLGHTVAVSSFSQMNLNVRKKNCKVIYMSAQDRHIAYSIREQCREMWLPLSKEQIVIENESLAERARYQRTSPAENPDNFRMACAIWSDYPYRRANIYEDAEKRDGFGRPSKFWYERDLEMVRYAMLLNDTFELAAVGAARMARRNEVKANLQASLEGRGPRNGAAPEPAVRGGGSRDPHGAAKRSILEYFVDLRHSGDVPAHIRAGHLASELGLSQNKVGTSISELFDVPNVQRKGYPTAAIYQKIDGFVADSGQ